MEYQVKLDIFEGPLDLLLHLIHKNEVDIFDIPIATITDQYLEYLEMMKALNINIAADFLVMASTLLHIKSKMLLPGFSEEDVEEDPRVEITRPLLEYMNLKSVVEELSDRELLHRDIFPRPTATYLREALKEEEPELDVNIFQLITAFKRILEEEISSTRLKYGAIKWSIKEKTAFILEQLKQKGTLYFREIFTDNSTLGEFVVTFLALLELVRSGLVRIYQPTENSDIRLTGRFEHPQKGENGQLS